MSQTSRTGLETDALGALGLNESERTVYRTLLESDAISAPDVVGALALSARTVHKTLASLELKGLITRLPERPPRYLPAPPDVAIEALIAKRQGELQQARLVGAHLHEQLTRRRGAIARHEERIVEIITGSEAQLRVFEQMQNSARNEFIGLDRAPYVMGAGHRNPAQVRAMARGVAYRAIVDVTTLELPGALERVRAHMAAGEDTRVFGGVSLKMMVADRSLALVPLNLERVYDAALLVRSSTLLDALC